MRLLFSIGAVLVAGMLSGRTSLSWLHQDQDIQPQRQAADGDAQWVDVELILAVDVSYSMDMDELAIQREGYAQAIQSKERLSGVEGGPQRQDRSNIPVSNGPPRPTRRSSFPGA